MTGIGTNDPKPSLAALVPDKPESDLPELLAGLG